MNQSDESSEIVEIDGQRYLVPTVFKDGQLVRDVDSKIKLPITITDNFHINRSSASIEKPTFKERLISIFTLGLH
jgi:hypothetical protein